MIYIDDHLEDFDLQQAIAAVSPQRRAQALRYRHERDQRLCLAAYRLLQHALSQEYGIHDLPQFTYTANGKPLLACHPDIHFSLSHCREAVAVAVSDRPIGIDVETLDHYSEDVARQVMNDVEMRRILASPHPDITFTQLWTMKESLFKLTDDAGHLKTVNLLDDVGDYRFTVVIHPRYVYTTCSAAH